MANGEEIAEQIVKQGDEVRRLKADKSTPAVNCQIHAIFDLNKISRM